MDFKKLVAEAGQSAKDMPAAGARPSSAAVATEEAGKDA